MDHLSNDNIPWDLVTAGLQRDLTLNENERFQLWLSENPENREKYDQLLQTWNRDLADYAIYNTINEQAAWDDLKSRLEKKVQAIVVSGEFANRRPGIMRRWIAVAAILLIVSVGLFRYVNNHINRLVYETGHNEQQKISLRDGSSIIMHPETKIQVANQYNNGNRTIILVSGEAFFEVKHQEQVPFIVNLGDYSVKDIGTSFTIRKTKDSIRVIVNTGRVVFIRNSSQEARELAAGMVLSCVARATNPDISIDSTAFNQSLRFENTPLLEVVNLLQLAYGKRIVLGDAGLGQKRLTANLGGESFEHAIEIICGSLSLEYAEKNDVYLLRDKHIQ
jgi:transmembrane sensor